MVLACTALWVLHLDTLRVLEIVVILKTRMLSACDTSNLNGVGVGGGVPGPAASHHVGTDEKCLISGSIPDLLEQTEF